MTMAYLPPHRRRQTTGDEHIFVGRLLEMRDVFDDFDLSGCTQADARCVRGVFNAETQ